MSEQNKPLLSDDMIELFNDAKALDCDNNMSEDAAFHFVNGHLAGMNEISGIYEQARTKDRELIQTLGAERDALLRERDNLRNFIENIIGKECWNRVEYLDGGDVQDEAERMGVLVQVPHATPCEDELCGCEGEDVDYLYNFAWRVSTLNTEKA